VEQDEEEAVEGEEDMVKPVIRNRDAPKQQGKNAEGKR